MKIGKYNLSAIDTVTFGLDGGAMFGIIPKPLWQKFNPADEQNRVTLGARSLLLEDGNRKILIDTGMERAGMRSLNPYTGSTESKIHF
jgi:hypothetical protein